MAEDTSAPKGDETKSSEDSEFKERAPDLDFDGFFSDEEPPAPEDKASDEDKSASAEKSGGKEEAKSEKSEAEQKADADATAAADKKAADEAKAAEEKKAADEEKKAARDKLSDEDKAAADKKEADDKKAAEKKAAAEKGPTVDELKASLEKTEKRRADTARWANEVNQRQLLLERELTILKKQREDPDYDPAKDESLDTGPTVEEQNRLSEQKGRASASLKAAFGKYGEEAVRAELREYRDLFAEDVAVQQQVLAAEEPIEEALSMVRMSKFFTEYGKDPETIVRNIEAKVTKELTPKIQKEQRESIVADLKKSGKSSKGLSGVKGSAADDKKEERADDKPSTLEQEFDQQ